MISNYDLQQLRIMAVDDSRHMNQLLGAILRGLGIQYFEAHSDPARAFDAIGEFKPDIVFLDWDMPKLDGAAFARLIRRDPKSPNHFLPIVVISAFGDREHVTRARDAGVNEFLVKPVAGRGVYDRIVSIIEQPREFVRAPGYVGPCRRRHKEAIYRGVDRRSATARKLTQAQVDAMMKSAPETRPEPETAG
jgi:PleD family two-component response regulator